MHFLRSFSSLFIFIHQTNKHGNRNHKEKEKEIKRQTKLNYVNYAVPLGRVPRQILQRIMTDCVYRAAAATKLANAITTYIHLTAEAGDRETTFGSDGERIVADWRLE